MMELDGKEHLLLTWCQLRNVYIIKNVKYSPSPAAIYRPHFYDHSANEARNPLTIVESIVTNSLRNFDATRPTSINSLAIDNQDTTNSVECKR